MVFLSGGESVQVFFRLFIYVLPLVIQLLRGEGWILNNRFNRHILVRLPSQGLNVKCHMSWSLCVQRNVLQVAETQREMLIGGPREHNLPPLLS